MSITEIDIRSSEWSESLDAMLRLQKAAYLIESQIIHYPQLPPLFETTQDLQHSGERFLIAQDEVNAAIVGMLSFEATATGFHIDRLVVDPNRFGKGIASRLLAAIEAIARHEGQPHITVSTAALNKPATRLYQKVGYQEVSRRTLADGLVLVVFEKILGK